jgi:hypothetical protein
VSGGTNIEPRTIAGRNLNKVHLTVEAFHGEHRVQTVARIGQVSTRNASNRFERQRFQDGYQRAIMWQDESDDRLNDMLLQTFAIALAAALGASYWPARLAARQPVVEGL